MWSRMSDFEKQKYQDQASKEAQWHKEKYPGYAYIPVGRRRKAELKRCTRGVNDTRRKAISSTPAAPAKKALFLRELASSSESPSSPESMSTSEFALTSESVSIWLPSTLKATKTPRAAAVSAARKIAKIYSTTSYRSTPSSAASDVLAFTAFPEPKFSLGEEEEKEEAEEDSVDISNITALGLSAVSPISAKNQKVYLPLVCFVDLELSLPLPDT